MLVGLIGSGIGGSLSPALHEAEAREQGLDLSYGLIDTDLPAHGGPLGRLLDRAQADGWAGLNITHPWKQRVLGLLDALSPQAEAIGAVNTVVLGADGRRVGHNTDAYGFAAAFRSGLPGAATGRVVQLGAGGAGAACAYAQMSRDFGHGATGAGADPDPGIGQLTVVDPDPGKRAGLAARFPGLDTAAPDELDTLLATADGLVNASPVGMHHHPGTPLPVRLLHRGLWVLDIVYLPVETALLRAARAAGLRTLGGAPMCAYQAAAAFELFTGHTADIARMLRHLGVLLAERGGHHAA